MIKRTTLLWNLLLLSICVQAQSYTWKQKASIPSSGRYGAFKFVIGNLGYVGGGCATSGSNLNDLWQYDPTNDVWTQKSSCPLYTRTAGSFAINTKGYVVGGINNSGNIINLMYEYDALTNSWSQKANYPGTPVYAAASFSIDGKGYFGIGNGGLSTGPYYNDFYEYDPSTNLWTSKASFPAIGRYGVNSVASLSYGYVGFGLNESVGMFYNDWYQYDPLTDSWTAKQSYPIALSNSSAFYINNKIYLTCGHDYNFTYKETYCFSEVSNSWVSAPDFTGGRRWAGFGFAINNIGYVGAGFDSTNYNTYSNFYEFSPTEGHDSIHCVEVKPDSLKGKDALVLSISPNSNYGNQQELLCHAWTCQGSPCIGRSLIEFDLSVIPANATFISATMNLHVNPTPVTIPGSNYGTNNSFVIRRVTSPWTEDLVTWNTQPATTTQNEVTIAQSGSANQNILNADVTSMVFDMLNNPQSSYGFMLKLVNEIPYNGRDFTSSDYTDSTLWPSITLCYIMPTGLNYLNENKEDIRVFPTLFQNNLTVEYRSNHAVGSLEMVDVTGRIQVKIPLKQTPGAITKLVLDENRLRNLRTNNMYFVRITDGDKVYVKRIIRTK